jgi:hypothetical protein
MNSLPKFNEAEKYVVTAVNPSTGSVSIESFIEDDYINWDSKVCNDKELMIQHISFLIKKQYPVVVTQTRLDQAGKVDYQVVINIHPESVTCRCNKGILCPLNKSQVNYYQGKLVTREMLAK